MGAVYSRSNQSFVCNFLSSPRCKSQVPAKETKCLTELSKTQNYAYWYARFFPGTHDFR